MSEHSTTDEARQILRGGYEVGPGWLVVRGHLWVFDRLYLAYGRAQRFVK